MNEAIPNYGKASALFGVIALICVLVIGLSISGDDGVSGPIINLITSLLGEANSPAVQAEYKTASAIEINEPGLRLILSILAICASISAAALAILAAKLERDSLWYAIGVFSSMAALTEINYFLCAIYALIVGVAVMWRRKWKMTPA